MFKLVYTIKIFFVIQCLFKINNIRGIGKRNTNGASNNLSSKKKRYLRKIKSLDYKKENISSLLRDLARECEGYPNLSNSPMD